MVTYDAGDIRITALKMEVMKIPFITFHQICSQVLMIYLQIHQVQAQIQQRICVSLKVEGLDVGVIIDHWVINLRMK